MSSRIRMRMKIMKSSKDNIKPIWMKSVRWLKKQRLKKLGNFMRRIIKKKPRDNNRSEAEALRNVALKVQYTGLTMRGDLRS